MTEKTEGMIYLEDGTVFRGTGFGCSKTAVGELVFNTSMTGYQEMLTDPVCRGQIVTMTYPIAGNYGIAEDDGVSEEIQAFGLVIKDLCQQPSNSMSVMSLDEWLKKEGVPAVCDVDTRMIVRKIRKEGTMKCVISTEGISISKAKEICSATDQGQDWMKTAGTDEVKVYAPKGEGPGLDIAVMDLGSRSDVLDRLCRMNCRLTLWPYGTPAEKMLSEKPDGVFITNGPGDPKEATEAIEEVKKIIHDSEVPIFAIGLGHQILARAFGGETYKMKHGHRGSNSGVYDKNTKRSYVTAQNHGYGVDHESIILKGLEATHLNLNDGSVEGMEHRDFPIFSVQFQPDLYEGSGDSGYLFEKFVQNMKDAKPTDAEKVNPKSQEIK